MSGVVLFVTFPIAAAFLGPAADERMRSYCVARLGASATPAACAKLLRTYGQLPQALSAELRAAHIEQHARGWEDIGTKYALRQTAYWRSLIPDVREPVSWEDPVPYSGRRVGDP
jgi:hypothetical protein